MSDKGKIIKETITSTSKIQSKAKTKCYIINNDTRSKLVFQFSPTSIPYSRSANYTVIESPGMSYPLTQYSGGNVREFSFDVFYYDKPYTGSITKARKFLEALLPPEKNVKKVNGKVYKKPPTFTFAYGYFVREYVLLQLNVSDEMFTSSGYPTMTTFTLTVRQVGK